MLPLSRRHLDPLPADKADADSHTQLFPRPQRAGEREHDITHPCSARCYGAQPRYHADRNALAHPVLEAPHRIAETIGAALNPAPAPR